MRKCEKINEKFLYHDDFYDKVKECIKLTGGKGYNLVSLDFDNFNFINDLFSYEVGDKVLNHMTERFMAGIEDGEFFSNIHADHFVFFVIQKNNESVAQRFYNMCDTRKILDNVLPSHYNLVCSGGIVGVEEDFDSLPAFLDKANFARKQAKGSSVNTFLYYDKQMDNELNWRKKITVLMEAALKNGEFEMYLQPKVAIKTGKIAGAEALARWNSPKYGIIFPDKFIPILEQNGFIKQLDFFMLEQACSFLRKSKALGIPLLPISVNFSKVHVGDASFVEKVYKKIRESDISAQYIEVEFTESTFSNDYERLIDIASSLKHLGFKVALDDFGSAYSSLSYLKTLPFDVIKIDKEFLSTSTGSEKGEIIIAKMIDLIRSLKMVSVMEGVETVEQASFLSALGCDFGQGYVFAKPMTIKDYIDYVKKDINGDSFENVISGFDNNNKEIANCVENHMDNWEFYVLGKNINMGVMKALLDDEPTIQHINDKALQYLGYTSDELKEVVFNKIENYIFKDDKHFVLENAHQLINTGVPLEFCVRAIRKDGATIVLKGCASRLIDSGGKNIGLYVFQDITEEFKRENDLQKALQEKVFALEKSIEAEKKSREALRVSEGHCKIIIDKSDDIMFEWDFSKDSIKFSDKYEKLLGGKPFSKGITTSLEVRKNICLDDMPVFEKWVNETYKKSTDTAAEFRIRKETGEYIWMRIRSISICDENGEPYMAVGVFSNIDNEKREINKLTQKVQLDPLTKIYNKEEVQQRIQRYIAENPDGIGAFIIIDIDNFKGVNDNLGHQFGDMVLRDISDKVSKMFRTHDIVGRLGGDEIAIFVTNFEDYSTVLMIAERTVKKLHSTYYGESSRYDVTVSVGVALYPEHGSKFEELYRNADVALYASKHAGKNRYSIYNDGMTDVLQDSRTPVDWSERAISTYFKDDLIFNIFELLYETKEINTTIQLVLEFIGKYFSVDRVYIFEHSADGLTTSNTYEWCAEDIVSEKENLQNLFREDLGEFFNSYDQNGILNCYDTSKMDIFSYKVLQPQGVKSLLHCAFYDKGVMTGFLGFDFCKDNREWKGDEVAGLGYLARMLSVFISKQRTMNKLMESNEYSVKMIDNLNGYVYVVDFENYEILYVNKAASSFGVKVGGKCYKETLGMEEKCANCPIKNLTNNHKFDTQRIFSIKLNSWVNTAVSKIQWKDNRQAVLVCCTEIPKVED